MRKQIARALTTVTAVMSLTFLPLVSAASAQGLHDKMAVLVPFDFTVSQKTFGSGEITINRVSQSNQALMIRSADGQQNEIRLTRGVLARGFTDKAKLVFHKYGNQYFLTEVWESGSDVGFRLPTCARERSLEREVAKSAAPPAERVIVLAKMR